MVVAQPTSMSPRVWAGGLEAPVFFPPLAKGGSGGVVMAQPVSCVSKVLAAGPSKLSHNTANMVLFILHPFEVRQAAISSYPTKGGS